MSRSSDPATRRNQEPRIPSQKPRDPSRADPEKPRIGTPLNILKRPLDMPPMKRIQK